MALHPFLYLYNFCLIVYQIRIKIEGKQYEDHGLFYLRTFDRLNHSQGLNAVTSSRKEEVGYILRCFDHWGFKLIKRDSMWKMVTQNQTRTEKHI